MWKKLNAEFWSRQLNLLYQPSPVQVQAQVLSCHESNSYLCFFLNIDPEKVRGKKRKKKNTSKKIKSTGYRVFEVQLKVC